MHLVYRLTEITLFVAVALTLTIMAAALSLPPMSETDFLAIEVPL